MLIGYGRVSTAEQNPAHQVDALRRAGVAPEDVYLDIASGAKSSRPQFDVALKVAREGDQLVITRLDRLGRSVLHLVTLGAQLRERGVGLRVLEQGIDTATAEGRAMFGMLSVLAELQRELIVANTRDGLAAARARGRTGGRRPTLSADQVRAAQRMYDEGEHTVAQIADILKVKRSTLYGHLDKASLGARPRAAKTTASPVGAILTTPLISNPPFADQLSRPVRARIRRPGELMTPREQHLADRLVGQRAAIHACACPSCGNEPIEASERWQQRQDLAIVWLYPDPEHPEQLIERRHCRQCQPHQHITTLDCALCGEGPFLTGTLATPSPEGPLPDPVSRWLADTGWRTTPELICPQHTGGQVTRSPRAATRLDPPLRPPW
jgi:DNA invertase Pin-like site-specific DNA recombinase